MASVSKEIPPLGEPGITVRHKYSISTDGNGPIVEREYVCPTNGGQRMITKLMEEEVS